MDNFATQASGLNAPATRHLAITPSDSTDLTFVPRSIRCIAAGTIRARDAFGTDIDYPMEVGEHLDIRVVRVLATGTSGSYVAWE